jgi:HSP20 family molecular chaperone IbpA
MTLVSVKPQAGRLGFPRFTNWFDTMVENEFTNEFFEGVRTPVLVNTKEGKDSYTIEVAAPGYANCLKLEVHENILTISTEKSENKTEEEQKMDTQGVSLCCFQTQLHTCLRP